jgi:hypothetical protein
MMATASRRASEGLVLADCAEDNFDDGEDPTFDFFISNSIYLCGWAVAYNLVVLLTILTGKLKI